MRFLPCQLVLSVSVTLFSLTAQGVSITDVRIAFEQKEEHVLVREMLTLKPEVESYQGETPYVVPLPAGARRAQVMEENGERGVAVSGKSVSVTVPKEGRVVQLMFELPVLNGVVALDQQFKSKVVLAHAAFVGFQP